MASLYEYMYFPDYWKTVTDVVINKDSCSLIFLGGGIGSHSLVVVVVLLLLIIC